MKKFIVVFMIVLLLSSCKGDIAENSYDSSSKEMKYEEYNVSEWISLTSEDDLFRITVFISKLKFTEEERIDLFSIVEYIGVEEEIDTWSGKPNFKYIIFDGTDFYCEAFQHDILKKTTFKKGEVYKYSFKKSGGWSADDPRADYWKSYYQDPQLKLPTGTYEVTAFCDFSFNDAVPFDQYRQEVKFEITVE